MRLTYRKKFRWKFHHSRFGFWDFAIFKTPNIPKKSQNPKSAFSPLVFSYSFWCFFLIQVIQSNAQKSKKQDSLMQFIWNVKSIEVKKRIVHIAKFNKRRSQGGKGGFLGFWNPKNPKKIRKIPEKSQNWKAFSPMWMT